MIPFLLSWFDPALNAFNPFNSLPFDLRWRLLLFQPIVLLINSMKYIPWLLSHRYTTIHIPNRHGHPLRTLIFHQLPSSRRTNNHQLAPLHVSIHAGGFMAGIPEYNAAFAALLSARTGALVALPTYRFAPLHPFPAAVDDIDDVLAWLRANAAARLAADPALLTVSGFSAGANLALAATQRLAEHDDVGASSGGGRGGGVGGGDASGAIKASVTFYAPVDLRRPPHEKPVPVGLPKTNLVAAILPLSDAYVTRSCRAGGERGRRDPRLHPVLAELRSLPARMLFIVPALDILVQEQLGFVERLSGEVERERRGRRGREREGEDEGEGEERIVECLVVEGQVHGWVELPDWAINKKTKDDAFDKAVEFIRETHRQHGWEWAV